MDQKTRYWLAGLLEGEGSFMAGSPSRPHSPTVCMTTTDEDVIQRVSDIFGVKHCMVRDGRYSDNGWKTAYVIRIKGAKAVAFMKSLRPLMGERRQQQIDKAMASYKVFEKRLSKKEVLAIRELCKEGKITQREIGKKFDITRECVNKVYRRKTHNI